MITTFREMGRSHWPAMAHELRNAETVRLESNDLDLPSHERQDSGYGSHHQSHHLLSLKTTIDVLKTEMEREETRGKQMEEREDAGRMSAEKDAAKSDLDVQREELAKLDRNGDGVSERDAGRENRSMEKISADKLEKDDDDDDDHDDGMTTKEISGLVGIGEEEVLESELERKRICEGRFMVHVDGDHDDDGKTPVISGSVGIGEEVSEIDPEMKKICEDRYKVHGGDDDDGQTPVISGLVAIGEEEVLGSGVERERRKGKKRKRDDLVERGEGWRDWTDLQLDVLVCIFSLLTVKLRFQVASVCKSWHNAALNPAVWRENMEPWQEWCSEDSCNRVRPKVARNIVMRAQGGLRSLRIVYCNPETLEFLARNCPLLERLELGGCGQVVRESCKQAVHVLGDQCKAIYELRLWCTGRDITMIFAKRLPNLTALFLFVNLIDDNSVSEIAEYLPKLEVLGLSGQTLITDTGLGFIGRKMKKLKTLHIARLHRVTAEAMRRLRRERPDLTISEI